MQKTVRVGRLFHLTFRSASIQNRSFLSDAYRCQEAWDRRFESPLLQNIDSATLFFDIGQKFRSIGKASAVDIDIFVNTIQGDSHAEEVVNMLKELRLTPETSNTLDSTHHAVVRYMLDYNKKDVLFEILHDRYQFGIFPDDLTYNLLMDTFIEQKDFTSAAKVAVLIMLQEELHNPICNALCVYSCHKFLENPNDWPEPKIEEPKDDEEEIKIRVKYLRNPYFDDHFDLKNPRDLVGKTLAFQGKHMNNVLGRSCQLRGLILYKKYNDAKQLAEDMLRNHKQDEIVHEEVFSLIEKDNAYIPEDQISEEFKNLQAQLNALKKCKLSHDNMHKVMEDNIKTAINAQAQKDIDLQCQAYSEWQIRRQIVIEKQIAEMKKQATLEQIKEIKKDLEERERVLTFFEHEEEIELEIEKLEKEDELEYNRLREENKKILKKLQEDNATIDSKFSK